MKQNVSRWKTHATTCGFFHLWLGNIVTKTNVLIQATQPASYDLDMQISGGIYDL